MTKGDLDVESFDTIRARFHALCYAAKSGELNGCEVWYSLGEDCVVVKIHPEFQDPASAAQVQFSYSFALNAEEDLLYSLLLNRALPAIGVSHVS